MKLSTIFAFAFATVLHAQDLERETEFLGPVQGVQQKDHHNGADEHRNGSENPQQQGEGEVVASQSKGEEVLAPVDELVHVLRCQTRSIVAHRNAEQETRMARVPDGLHMANKCEEEAEQEAQVFESGGDVARLSIHKILECLAGAS